MTQNPDGTPIETSSTFSTIKNSSAVFFILSFCTVFGIIFAVYTYISMLPNISIYYKTECNDVLEGGSKLDLFVANNSDDIYSVSSLFYCSIRVWNAGNSNIGPDNILDAIILTPKDRVINELVSLIGAHEGKHLSIDRGESAIEIELISLFPRSGIKIEYYSQTGIGLDVSGSYMTPSGVVAQITNYRKWSELIYAKFELVWIIILALYIVILIYHDVKKSENAKSFFMIILKERVLYLGPIMVVSLGLVVLASMGTKVLDLFSNPPF